MVRNKYILATHVWNDGPSQALKEYLIKNNGDFIWISHPLFYSKRVGGSGYSVFQNGQEIKSRYFQPRKLIEPLKYIIEIILNIFFVIRLRNTKDHIYIGYNNLNTFSGIILRKFGQVDKVIYYVIDYMPRRFSNGLLNYIYHKLDQFCVKYADETWGLSEKAMNDARKKYYNFNAYTKGYSIQKEIPMGFWRNRIKIKQLEEINKTQIVFMGHLLEKQGVQFVLNALPLVIKKIPDIKFIIMGDGEYAETLKKLAKDLHIEDRVLFTGFVEKLEDIENTLASSALAVALYEEGNPDVNFTYYTDQGKIKNYLGCGLPILLSSVPPIARDIEKNNCGCIINNDPVVIADKIIEVLSDQSKLKFYRDNVFRYKDQFDWNVIFKDI